MALVLKCKQTTYCGTGTTDEAISFLFPQPPTPLRPSQERTSEMGPRMAARSGQTMIAEQNLGQTSGGGQEYFGMHADDGFDHAHHESTKHRLKSYEAPHVPEGHHEYKEGDHKPYTQQFYGKVVDSEEEVSHWTEPVVAGWLASLENGAFESYCINIMNHHIDGPIMLRLTESHLDEIGVHSVGDRMKLLDHIQLVQRRCKKPNTSRIAIPGWGTCLFRMLDFGWADTSEGKSGNEIKDELVQANTSIGLVSTLTWSIAWDLFFGSATSCFCHNASTDCVCSTSWDMEGRPLVVFYCFAGLAAFFFMFSTIYSVLQIIMVNEMSDENEVLEFFDLLKADSQLPGVYLFVGMIFFSVPVCVYLIYNINLGLYPGPLLTSQTIFSWIVSIVALLMTIWGFLYKIPQMIKFVYQAKKQACAKDRLQPSHSYHGHFAAKD